MYLTIGKEVVKWIHLGQDRDQCWVVVNKVLNTNLTSIKGRNSRKQLRIY
jgi:hypothetical protein